MATKLTIVTRQEKSGIGGREFEYQRIVGITPSNAATMLDVDIDLEGAERERELCLSPEMLARLEEFYRVFRATVRKPSEEWPWYHCHAFAAFMTGRISLQHILSRGPDYRWAKREVVESNEFMQGEAYGVVDHYGGNMHSVVGIDTPTESVSAQGTWGPIAIADNAANAWVLQGQLMHLRDD